MRYIDDNIEYSSIKAFQTDDNTDMSFRSCAQYLLRPSTSSNEKRLPPPSHPGRPASSPLIVTNTFAETVTLADVESDDPAIRFVPAKAFAAGGARPKLAPNVETVVGEVHFDPSTLPEDAAYLGGLVGAAGHGLHQRPLGGFQRCFGVGQRAQLGAQGEREASAHGRAHATSG